MAAARSVPDGYTFLHYPNSVLRVIPQPRKIGYDLRKDFTPIGRLGGLHYGFNVGASLSLYTHADVIS